MTVLHICHNYLGTKVYKNLFDAQEQIGIKNIVYLPIKCNEHENIRNNAIILNMSYRLNSLFFFHKQNKIYKDIQKRVDLTKVDVIHAHMLFVTGYAAYKLSKKYNIPFIVTVRNTDVNSFYKKNKLKHLKHLGEKIMVASTNIVFLTSKYKEQLLNNHIKENKQSIQKKCEIIPNGTDDFFYENKSKVIKNLNNSIIKLIYVGSISTNKNLETTIDAAKKLINERFNVEFIVVGEILEKKYEKLIKENNFIKYHGKCDKQKVCEYLNEADIFVMPSHAETFGLVYAEAMSQGLPVIYTRGQGFDGQFEEGVVGYSVNAKSSNEIVEKIKLIRDNYTTISQNCINLVDGFRWENVAVKYKNVYIKMCSENVNKV